jgi:hypothetical protein
MDALARHSTDTLLRLAVVSTPRSGNTWLRRLLATVYDAASHPVHNPADVDWSALPERYVLQIHWRPTPALLDLLRQHQFRVLTLARHPLDVLLSTLHFCLHDASTVRWLEGEGGDERCIYGAMPCSAAFLGYATGTRAAALLSVSRAWWSRPDAVRVRYEDLVQDPHAELERLVESLAVPVCRPIAEGVAAHSLSRQRRDDAFHDYHYWQGKPGLWRWLLPPFQARPLAAAFHAHLEEFGYTGDPNDSLNVRQADANWVKLVWEDLAMDLQNLKTTLAERDRLRGELGTMRVELQASEKARREAQEYAEAARVELTRFEGLGPLAIATARRLRRMSLRYPRLSALLKKLVRATKRAEEVHAAPVPPP